MHDTEALTMIVVMPVFFGASLWMLKLFLEYLRQRRLAKMLFDIQTRVLDKFGSSPEALQYLQSDAGRQFLEVAMTEKTNPRTRILGAVQAGLVLSALSVGFIIVRAWVPEGVVVFSVVGVLGLCLGVGYLGSAAVAFYLSKSWGLINGDSEPTGLDV